MSYGYASAERLWSFDKGNYNCDNIIQRYWVDVKRKVFTDCNNEWADSSSSSTQHLDLCKKGAEEFTMQRIGGCFQTADCYRLGLGASASVVGSFCNRNSVFRERKFLPRKCKEHAKNTCACDAVNLVDEFFTSGSCPAVTESPLDYVKQIDKLCDHEVKEMEKEAQLQY